MSRPKKITVTVDELPAYSRDALLTIQEVAQALRCSVRTVERADLPTIYVGRHTRRFHWGTVIDTLVSKAA
jgi:hypothetical protein